jgi:hypothetical protein
VSTPDTTKTFLGKFIFCSALFFPFDIYRKPAKLNTGKIARIARHNLATAFPWKMIWEWREVFLEHPEALREARDTVSIRAVAVLVSSCYCHCCCVFISIITFSFSIFLALQPPIPLLAVLISGWYLENRTCHSASSLWVNLIVSLFHCHKIN